MQVSQHTPSRSLSFAPALNRRRPFRRVPFPFPFRLCPPSVVTSSPLPTYYSGPTAPIPMTSRSLSAG
jgi:hypothetical protein